MDVDDETLKEVAEQIITKLEARLSPLAGALADLADVNDELVEENATLVARVERLERMLGLREYECSCEECSKLPAHN